MFPHMTFFFVIWLHFFGDFVCQTDKMALNKSKKNKWLGIHCLVYTLVMMIAGWKFALFNGVCHFIIDYITSRGTSYLWQKEERHWFFTLIGFDQAIHLTLLFITFYWS